MRMRAAAVTAALGAGIVGPAVAPIAAQATNGVPTITATVTSKAVTLSSGHTVQAGRVIFKVVVPKGDHELQLLKLAPGYTTAMANKDINAAFSGKVAAVKRVDTKITWFGGAEATPGKAGYFAETLYAGKYYLIDQNSHAHTTLTVTGSPVARPWIANSSTIIGNAKDRFGGDSVLPHSGWTLVRDTSDEPHFVVFQQVKKGTTRHDVEEYFKAGDESQPAFALGPNTSTGVISGGTQMLFHYSLPKGEYVILCFWPSDENGMPHAMMGMYKIITLK